MGFLPRPGYFKWEVWIKVTKVVIVEDEPLMNRYIVESVNWNDIGMELAGVFYNGLAAYEFIKENDIDILVTDIQMPLMDGLTLISKAKEIKEDMTIIVLSNYDDFDIVKKSFKKGVYDYILKTDFEPDLFRDMLLGASQKEEGKTDKLSVNMKEYMLRQFFWSDSNGANISEAYFNNHDKLRVAVLKLINYDDVIKSEWSMEKELMKYGLANCVAETLENYGFGDFFFNTYDEIVFAFDEKDNKNSCETVKKAFTDIFEFLSEKFKIVSAGVLYDDDLLPDHKEQYYICSRLLAYSFFFGSNKLMSEKTASKFKDEPDVSAISERIENCLKNMEIESLCEQLKQMETIKPAYDVIYGIKDLYVNVIKKLIKIFKNYDLSASVVQLSAINMDISCVPELNRAIIKECTTLKRTIEYSDVAIIQVQNYIKENYSSNINLQFLAKEFLFSYTDLSRRFKKSTGMSFSEFLNDIRLTEAMKLIKTTDYRCSKIAYVVGYKNYESFSRAFKEKYHKAPNEIRKPDKQ